MPADLIISNANIYTLDVNENCPQANSLAVREGKFVAVGDIKEIDQQRGSHTEVINLAGQTVLPGLCDAHIHFTLYGLNLNRIDLFAVPSLAELQQGLKVKADSTPAGTWLRGFGWNQNLWPENRFPTRHDLDAITTHHAVILTEKSVHAAVVNSLALQQAGINEHTPNPSGGEIVRDATGQATGLLLEWPAVSLVQDLIPAPTALELDQAVLQAQRLAHQMGLTAIHDLDGRQGLQTFQRLREKDQLRLRTVSHIAMEQLDSALDLGLRAGLGDEWLRIGGLKLFADGALGPRTAAMLAPYENEPDNVGLTIVDKEDMIKMASQASAAGLPTLIHAIGDRANHDVLDVFEIVRTQEAERGELRASRRHRIEHVQLLHPDDLARLSQLDVIASMQPIHATQDMYNVDAYWGERGRLSYAFRSLLNSGARLAFGSDAPVETPNPFAGLHAAVTLRRADGSPGPAGWHAEQGLTTAESLAAYTLGAAYAVGLEDRLGSITPGKYADFIVPDRDIFSCDPMALHEVKVVMTVVGGEVVWG